MFNNIICSGGNTQIPNFKERLQYEIEFGGLLTENIKTIDLKVSDAQSAWRGLKKMSENPDFMKKYCVSK